MQRLAIPNRAVYAKVLLMATKGQCVGGVCLQLDGVGAGLFRSVNEGHGAVKAAIVIGRDFRHDEGRLACPHLPRTDFEASRHRSLRRTRSNDRAPFTSTSPSCS